MIGVFTYLLLSHIINSPSLPIQPYDIYNLLLFPLYISYLYDASNPSLLYLHTYHSITTSPWYLIASLKDIIMNGTLTITTNHPDILGLTNQYNKTIVYFKESVQDHIDQMFLTYSLNRLQVRSVIFTPSPVIITRY